MRLNREKVDLWLHAGLFSLYLGPLSLFGFARRIDPSLGSAAQLAFILLTWALTLYAVWRARRLPMWGVVLLALLPYAHMVWFAVAGEPSGGAFSYLYKFSGFLIAPYLWLWVRSRSDAVLERTLMLLATVLAARAVLTFLVPGLATASGRFADDFIVYEWVGPLPRIFYPGMAVVFLGLMISLRNVFQAPDRRLVPEVLRAILFLTALSVNLSRGILFLVALVTLLLLLVKFSSAGVTVGRKGRLVLGTLLALSGTGLLVASTPLADTVSRAAGEYAGEERFSLNQKNLDWRVQQVQAAFRMLQTPDQHWLGVGTNTFIPESIENPVPGEVTNELHYSYHSVRWTFGLLGLLLLIGFTLLEPTVRTVLARPDSPLVLPLLFTGAFIGLVGVYTVVFTTADWSFTLALCGAYLNARTAARPAARHPVSPGRPLPLPVRSARRWHP